MVHSLGVNWSQAVTDLNKEQLEQHYDKAFQFAKQKPPTKIQKEKVVAQQKKKPRQTPPLPLQIEEGEIVEQKIALSAMGDNKTVIDWLEADARVLAPKWRKWIDKIYAELYELWAAGCTALAMDGEMPWKGWFRHIFRENNGRADALANEGRTGKVIDKTRAVPDTSTVVAVRAFFDGSFSGNHAGIGWTVQAAAIPLWARRVESVQWREVAWGAAPATEASVIGSETEAAFEAVMGAVKVVKAARGRHGVVY